MTVKIPGVTFNFAGEEFVFAPLPLGFVEQNISKLSGNLNKIDADTVGLVIDAAYTSLKRNYPDITRDFVRDSLDLGNFAEVMAAVMNVSGLVARQEAQSGEVAAS